MMSFQRRATEVTYLAEDLSVEALIHRINRIYLIYHQDPKEVEEVTEKKRSLSLNMNMNIKKRKK